MDAYGTTVADLEVSRLRLAANQSVPGYCILICTRHVREPYELPPAESAAFFRDLLRVGRAVETAFGAVKMNFEIQGNVVPHLHCHLKPRYYGDPAPERPIHPDARRELLPRRSPSGECSRSGRRSPAEPPPPGRTLLLCR